LRNGGGNLLYEASVSAFFGGLKDRCQFHALRILLRAALGKRPAGPTINTDSLTKDKEEELRRALEGASGAENGPSAG
jgi:hypothetical protein